MIKYFNTVSNERGDVLANYRVQVVDSLGASVDIFADAGGTRFTDSGGNIVNYTEAQANGRVAFYWTPADGQVLQTLDASGNLVDAEADFANAMVLENLPGNIGQDAVTGLVADLAAKADDAATTAALATKAATADLASTDAGKGAALVGYGTLTAKTALDRAAGRVRASAAGFDAAMTAAEFEAAQTALLTLYSSVTIVFDLDIAIDTTAGGVTKPANVAWEAVEAGATLYPTAAVASFVTASGDVTIGKALTLDGRSRATSHVLQLASNSVAKDLRGLTVTAEGRVTYTGIKATDDTALTAIGSSIATIANVVGIETRDNVTGVIEGVYVFGIGNGIQINRSTHDLVIRNNTVEWWATRGIYGRATSPGITISDILVEKNLVGQALAGAAGRSYPITFSYTGVTKPKNIRVIGNTLDLGGRPFINGSVTTNNATGDSINFHGVDSGEITGNRTFGTGEAGITVSQGSSDIDVLNNYVDSAETTPISIGPMGEPNRNIKVIGNRGRYSSIDLNNDHGAQPFIDISNTIGLEYGGNILTMPCGLRVTGATQANPVVLTVVGQNEYRKGDPITVSAVGGMTQINTTHRVLYSEGNSIALADMDMIGRDGTGYTAYTSGGRVVPKADPSFGIAIRDSTSEGGGPTLGVRLIGDNQLRYPVQAVTITSITQANPAVATVGTLDGTNANSFTVGMMAFIRGANDDAWNIIVKIGAKSGNTLTLQDADGVNLDSTAFAAYTTGGVLEAAPDEVAVPLYNTLDYRQGRGHTGVANVNSTGTTASSNGLISATAKSATGVYTVDFKFPVTHAVATLTGATFNREISVELTSKYRVTVRTGNSSATAIDMPFAITGAG